MAPRKARRSYHHGNAREALIDAALTLLEEQGPAFSLRETARRVGIDPAACYRHFRDREALLIAIAQRGFMELAQRMAKVSAELEDPDARVVALGREYVTFAQEEPGFFRVMFGESGRPARDPSLRAPELEKSGYDLLEDAVRAWAAHHKVNIDVPLAALAAWAGVHGLARLIVDGAVPMQGDVLDALLVTVGLAPLVHLSRSG